MSRVDGQRPQRIFLGPELIVWESCTVLSYPWVRLRCWEDERR
jgi:hypothetical protein